MKRYFLLLIFCLSCIYVVSALDIAPAYPLITQNSLEESQYPKATAPKMAKQCLALANTGGLYALTFNDKNIWSQKCNLVWDKLLQLNLFTQEVYDKEINYYLTKQNIFGLPLASRKTYRKSVWVIWKAKLTKTQSDFNNSLNRYTSLLPKQKVNYQLLIGRRPQMRKIRFSC